MVKISTLIKKKGYQRDTSAFKNFDIFREQTGHYEIKQLIDQSIMAAFNIFTLIPGKLQAGKKTKKNKSGDAFQHRWRLLAG